MAFGLEFGKAPPSLNDKRLGLYVEYERSVLLQRPLSKEWLHQLTLGNVDLVKAEAVMKFVEFQLVRLDKRRHISSPWGIPSRKSLDPRALLKDVLGPWSMSNVSKRFPSRTFVEAGEHIHELRLTPRQEWFNPGYIRRAAEYGLERGIPLELLYASERSGHAGSKLTELHTRYLNVRSIDEFGLRATHNFGVRRYSWDKILWATPVGKRPEKVGPERSLLILFKPSGHQGGWRADLSLAQSMGDNRLGVKSESGEVLNFRNRDRL